MPIIDLSMPIDASFWSPEPIEHDIVSPADGARHMSEEMKEKYGLDLDPSVLPDGELLSIDYLKLNSHAGTHVDAPSHYGTRASYRDGGPRTIDEMPLDWFHRPGVLLDLSEEEPGAVDADTLDKEFARIGYRPEPYDIVLLRTGASDLMGSTLSFSQFVGLDASATNFLLDLGVKVIGTDAFSLDAPFDHMITAYNESQDPSVLWPAHVAGRDREYCQIEQLANLDQLPAPFGFTVICMPVKIAGGGAGWARAVAVVD